MKDVFPAMCTVDSFFAKTAPVVHAPPYTHTLQQRQRVGGAYRVATGLGKWCFVIKASSSQPADKGIAIDLLDAHTVRPYRGVVRNIQTRKCTVH